MSDLVGTVIAGRYELGAVIGTGGHGVIYRALDRTEKRDVAVKVLNTDFREHPEYAARLTRERDALVALAGTSAVACYDLCTAPTGALCLVLELLVGEDLEQRLAALEAKGERLAPERLVEIFDPIVDTLERAHDVGILHRDLKPGNIFLLASGHDVRLFDFGLSRMKTAPRLTVVGTVMGSPSYIAPEVWKGVSDELDTRVDVYSLGVILFRTLTGHLPFEGTSLRHSLELATKAPRPSLHQLRPDLPTRTDVWVERALAIDRDARYQTVRDLWDGLGAAVQPSPTSRLSLRPAAVGLAAAWRAATSALRKFVPRGTGESERPPESRSAPPSVRPDTSHVDEGWAELTDDEIDTSESAAAVGEELSRPTGTWEIVTEKDLDAALEPVDDGWAEVTDPELDRPSLYADVAAIEKAAAALAAEPAAKPDRAKKRGKKRANQATKTKAKKKDPKPPVLESAEAAPPKLPESSKAALPTLPESVEPAPVPPTLPESVEPAPMPPTLPESVEPAPMPPEPEKKAKEPRPRKARAKKAPRTVKDS